MYSYIWDSLYNMTAIKYFLLFSLISSSLTNYERRHSFKQGFLKVNFCEKKISFLALMSLQKIQPIRSSCLVRRCPLNFENLGGKFELITKTDFEFLSLCYSMPWVS